MKRNNKTTTATDSAAAEKPVQTITTFGALEVGDVYQKVQRLNPQEHPYLRKLNKDAACYCEPNGGDIGDGGGCFLQSRNMEVILHEPDYDYVTAVLPMPDDRRFIVYNRFGWAKAATIREARKLLFKEMPSDYLRSEKLMAKLVHKDTTCDGGGGINYPSQFPPLELGEVA